MSKIQWTDKTWNPIVGCSRKSKGCRNCFAIRMARRLATMEHSREAYEGLTKGDNWTGVVRLLENRLDQPLRWKKPRRVFVNSMSDLFHESLTVPEITRVFSVMERAKQHIFQVLTKRPERMQEYLVGMETSPLPNVHCLVSIEDQKTAEARVPYLLRTPAAMRGVSAEPLLGAMDLFSHSFLKWNDNVPMAERVPCLDWVICGAESGPGARPMDPEWARSLRDQCKAAGVPFFMKQMSKKAPIPEDLLIREFPSA